MQAYQGNMLFVAAYRLSRKGNCTGALELIDEAAAENGLPKSLVALLLNNLGAGEMARKNWSSAASFLAEAISRKRRLGDPHSLGLSCGNLGFVYMELGRFLEGTQFVIEGTQLIASSPYPESNAQLVSNFLTVSLTMAPEADRKVMRDMWSAAGLDGISWPPTTIATRFGE